jgi:hypothetical protein
VDILVVKVEKNDSFTILGRKSGNCTLNGLFAIFVVQPATRRLWIMWFNDFIERNRHCWDPAQFRTIEVRRQCEEPRRKRRIPAPSGQPTISAKKGFLGHVLRPSTVTAKSVSQIYKRTLPSPDDALESGNIPGKNFLDVSLICARTHRRVPAGKTWPRDGRLHFLLAHAIRKF